MIVAGFMTPRKDVVKCLETDPISTVIDAIMDNHISAVVVLDKEEGGSPVGIVTKTDLVAAYKQETPIQEPVSSIMNRSMLIIKANDSKDDVAKIFERMHTHHALVKDSDGNFVGLTSTWDIAAECAKDARAWPWTRTPDGRVHTASLAH
jgi:CBS domain containing-hemolysin-like protein